MSPTNLTIPTGDRPSPDELPDIPPAEIPHRINTDSSNPKKGNLKDCKNWTGIMLLSIPGKVFNRILLEIMKIEVDRLLREE